MTIVKLIKQKYYKIKLNDLITPESQLEFKSVVGNEWEKEKKQIISLLKERENVYININNQNWREFPEKMEIIINKIKSIMEKGEILYNSLKKRL